MSFLKEWSENRSKKQEQAEQAGRQQKDETLAYMSNPNSNVDEVGKVIAWLIVPAFALWVGYIGYLYTMQQLDGVVSPDMVVILAVAIPAGVQFIKLYTAKKVLRAWHFKWYDHSAADFWLWSLMGCVVVLMFAWSLKISIFDVRDTASNNYMSRDTVTLSQYLATQTAAVDQQIAGIDRENSDAGSMRTKKGNIAWTGQQIKERNSSTLLSLQDQKKQITDQAISDYRAGKLKTATAAEGRGNFFRRFGGFGEAGEILFLLIMGLIEARNRRDNMERIKQAAAATMPRQNGYQAPAPSLNRTQIGFKMQGQMSPVSDTNHETVAQPVDTVAQPQSEALVIGPDAALKHYRSVILRDLPNLTRSDAKIETVCNRIHVALDDMWQVMQHQDFKPSASAAANFYGFMVERVEPALKRAGDEYYYPKTKAILHKMLELIPVSQASSIL